MTRIIEVNNHSFFIENYHVSLRTWDAHHRRMFPWRLTSEPFHIMVAELMLRRTQARQVVGIYDAFIEKYPDFYALAMASSEDVFHSLFSLGLSWRVPAFQQIAHIIVEQFDGKVPNSYETLIGLPGIGDYVASAICCFAFGQTIPIIDTNTVRIAGRLFGIQTDTESRRRKSIRTILKTLLDQEEVKAYNYALLDIAALICMPINPHCSKCPLLAYCITGQEQIYVGMGNTG